MKAIGMIETKGMIAAIEGADVMLKTADIRLINKNIVGGGLVAVTIEGDVAAVKASVDAAVSAIENLGRYLLVSNHVIPRPTEDIAIFFQEKEKLGSCDFCDRTPLIEKEKIEENEENLEQVVEGTIEVVKEIEKTDYQDDFDIKDFYDKSLKKEDLEKIRKHFGDQSAISVLGKLSLSDLRRLIVEYEEFKGLNVSKLSKKILIEKIIRIVE